MTHTIRAQYDLIADKEALASDFGAMLDWIEQWDMKPCNSVYFGEEVNALLVRNWIAFRNSLKNTLNHFERSYLEECAREACEPDDFYEIQDCIDEITDGQLMALGRLFYPGGKALVKQSESITSIAVEWCVEDVQSIRPDLTDEQAGAVLQAADRCHNAEIGINWDVLRFHADDLFPEEDEDSDQADELLPESSEVNSKYADSIIAGNPSNYDAIEVHGVRNINDADDPDGTHYEVDDENPELYSVYLHCIGGGIECVGDFSSNSLAEEYASELSVLYSWKVLHFPLVVIGAEDESAEELSPVSSEVTTESEFSTNDLPVFRCLRGFHTEQFVHDPEAYAREKYDAQLRETFYRKVNELLGQEFIDKPAATLASEVVTTILNGIAVNNCDKTLFAVYSNWLDSMSYRDSFGRYLAKYKLESQIDVWAVNDDHPFRKVDEIWLKDFGTKLTNKSLAQGERAQLIARLKQRHQSKQAQALGIVFWSDIIALLDFDPKDIAYLSSFPECVEFYKKHFCPLDTAIRNLYTEFLQQRDTLEPFQELYKEYVSLFLDKWFKYFGQYQEDQTGILQNIIDDNACNSSSKIAVIVGDGVAYEIAEQVANKVKKLGGRSELKRQHILADCPSETENNMSHIYMANGVVEAVQNKREKYLAAQNPRINIDFIRLDEVTYEALSGQVLICTYKDIDDMGDKLNHKALKYFPESIDFFAEKINQLLNIGYAKVYLITDHGFVLTGLLSEADKIAVKPSGQNYIDERFIWTSDKQDDLTLQFIEVAKTYKDYNYLYFARSMNPFKTPGAYGFAHGGLAPQELVTPFFCWEQESDGMGELPVMIANKHDLISVTGELYQLKLCADSGEGNLFTQERKVMLLFFANKAQVNKSDVIAIQSNGEVTKEYTFDGHGEVEVQLVDAITKQLLDRAVVKKNNDRDLGGLF